MKTYREDNITLFTPMGCITLSPSEASPTGLTLFGMTNENKKAPPPGDAFIKSFTYSSIEVSRFPDLWPHY